MFASPMHFYIHHYGTDQDLDLITRSAVDTQRAIEAFEAGDLGKARELWTGVDGTALLDTWNAQNDRAKEIGPKWKEQSEQAIGPRTPSVSQGLAKQIYERDGYRCRYCGLPVFTRWPGSSILQLIEAFPDLTPGLRLEDGKLYGSGVDGAITNKDYAKFLWSFAACDHVFPTSLGGATDETNLVTSCSGCNYSKGNLTLEQLDVESPFPR